MPWLCNWLFDIFVLLEYWILFLKVLQNVFSTVISWTVSCTMPTRCVFSLYVSTIHLDCLFSFVFHFFWENIIICDVYTFCLYMMLVIKIVHCHNCFVSDPGDCSHHCGPLMWGIIPLLTFNPEFQSIVLP